MFLVDAGNLLIKRGVAFINQLVNNSPMIDCTKLCQRNKKSEQENVSLQARSKYTY